MGVVQISAVTQDQSCLLICSPQIGPGGIRLYFRLTAANHGGSANFSRDSRPILFANMLSPNY
eukprot:1160012-Pelagomonas_calceolata.AAC.4